MLLPALGKAKQKAQGIACEGNLKQLQLAWYMYAQDHHDQLVPNLGRGFSNPGWMTGALTLDDVGITNPDNTNILHLRQSLLFPYLQSISVFKCPADRSTTTIRKVRYPRVRSLSMNNWLGNYLPDGSLGKTSFPGDEAYRINVRYSDLTQPSPSETFVFIDEREDSLNDAFFYVGMGRRGANAYIVDLPASYHNRAGGLSFADGHAEIHRWQDARTIPPLTPNQSTRLNFPSSNNPDVAWLQDHATGQK